MFAHIRQIDSQGENGLHKLIRACVNSHVVCAYLMHIGLEEAAKEATMVNNKGEIPLDILLWHASSPLEQAKLGRMLFLLHRINLTLPLKKFIPFESVLNEFPAEYDSPLFLNLLAACFVANLTRTLLSLSDSHPQYNELPHYYKKIVTDKLEQVQVNIERITALLECHPAFSSPQMQFVLLNLISRICTAVGAGNCAEYSKLTLYLLKLFAPELHAEVMGIRNGDHAFVVIGHDPTVNPADYRRWGENAVVCDSWAGRIFLGTTLETNLKSYRSFDLITGYSINTITSFNPNYHYLEPVFSIRAANQQEEEKEEEDDMDMDMNMDFERDFFPMDMDEEEDPFQSCPPFEWNQQEKTSPVAANKATFWNHPQAERGENGLGHAPGLGHD